MSLETAIGVSTTSDRLSSSWNSSGGGGGISMISSGDEGGLTFVGLVSNGSTGDGSGRLTGSTGAVDFFMTSTAG